MHGFCVVDVMFVLVVGSMRADRKRRNMGKRVKGYMMVDFRMGAYNTLRFWRPSCGFISLVG